MRNVFEIVTRIKTIIEISPPCGHYNTPKPIDIICKKQSRVITVDNMSYESVYNMNITDAQKNRNTYLLNKNCLRNESCCRRISANKN